MERRNKMKRKFILILVSFFCVFSNTVYAWDMNSMDYYINRNNITMSFEQYSNFINLGFTEQEIFNMKEEEFTNNENLIGAVVGKLEKYYKQQTKYDGNNDIISITDEEIDEQEYNEFSNNDINLISSTSGYIETNYKKMTTQIISISGKFRYKITLEWKNMPSVRSYDIIGIGFDSSVYVDSNIYFQQNYCYSSGNCSSSSNGYYKSMSNGGAVVFKLPTSSLNSLNSYLYFTVNKVNSNTIYELKAYGDYSHATSSISSELSNSNYTVNQSGIKLNSTIKNYYDEISTAIAKYDGSW